MIHKCKVQCHTVNPTDMDLLGIKDDAGKWLPFAIDLGIITAIKMSTDEEGEPTTGCSTVFCNEGSSFILDTPYNELLDIWMEYVNSSWEIGGSSNNDDDIIL